MTPEEKALKLVHDIYFAYGEVSMAQAKQCTLIAVDEILDNNCGSTTDYGVDAEDNELYMDEYFWMEVKQEIEKL